MTAVIALSPNDTPVVTKGLAYAARGWPVFPVDAQEKTPLITDWPNRATTDPKVIRATWGPNPEAGIGIVTGSKSGLVVVDLDVKNDKDGPGNWDSYLQSQGVDLPETLTVRTRSGGQHRYYRVPEGAEYTNSAGTIAEGVDVRGTGGYVVAPPTPGYEFITELDGAMLPELPVGVLPEKRMPATAQPRNKRSREYAFAAFSGGLDDLAAAAEGERNDTLNRVAYSAAQSVADGLVDEATVRGLLRVRGLEAGLSESEVRSTMDSAFSKFSSRPPDIGMGLSGPWGGPYVATYDLIWGEDSVRPAIWGPPDSPLWMPGESLMIAGESGLGKSTLAQSLVAGRIGLLSEVLGYPVEDDGGRVLYLAADRALQIRRMMRRVAPRDTDWASINDRLLIREGSPLVRLTDEGNSTWLVEQAQAMGVTTVVIDSLKNVILKPSDEGLANAYDQTRQALVNRGINLIEIHHTRKTTTQGQGGRGGMDDVHGSIALVAGAGSVLTLSRPRGADDDNHDVLLRQVKSLAGTHKATLLTLDIEAGLLNRADEAKSLENQISALFFWNNEDGTPKQLLPREIYPQLYPEGATTTQQSNVRKKLSQLVRTGELVKDREGRYMAKTSS
jgi:Bifunctional DNA primase/polymerase, N-terminal/AAA domain